MVLIQRFWLSGRSVHGWYAPEWVTPEELKRYLKELKPAPYLIDIFNNEGEIWALPDENYCKTDEIRMEFDVEKDGSGIIIWPIPEMGE